jgi:Na+/proline symporter
VLIFIVYTALIISITILQKKDWSHAVFKSSKKVSWFISGLSLYMLYLSVDQGQFLTGLISQHGMQGMWMVWAGWIGAFVVPIVFAPLWQKLDFITDNHFLLFRFPGKSGRMLHLFRAIYVGGLVVALSLCFHVIGFARVLEIYFNFSKTTSVFFTGCILCVFALKNIFDLKLKMDALHAAIYFVSFLIILLALWNKGNGLDSMYSFFENHQEKKELFPSKSHTNDWFSLFVFIGIQWWSCNLFDGGGPEMARFTSVKNKQSAILTGILPNVISLVLSFLVLGHIFIILGLSNTTSTKEIQYVETVFLVVPLVLKPLVLLGFFGMFITTAESLLNWGASFLTMDAYKVYVFPKASDRNIRLMSFTSMIFLSLLSMLFALQIDSLQSLVKITFSIAAGVAPVYILRWIWFRINAWSQMSAMLSSAIFTLVYPTIHSVFPFKQFPMEESRVFVVTVLTTIVWLSVTFLTVNQSDEVRLKMMPVLESKIIFIKRFFTALFFGILVLIFLGFIWTWIMSSF